MDAFGYDDDPPPPPYPDDESPPRDPNGIATIRNPSPHGRHEQSSPARPNTQPHDADTQPDYPYSSTIGTNAERHTLGYATIQALRERVAATMINESYRAPNARGTVPSTTETMAVQTEELPTREMGVGVTDTLIEGERTHELELGLCPAHDMPLMAVSQLLEAERRLSDLLNRLEAEVGRAEAQERRRVAREQEEEEEQTHGTFGRFESTAQWTDRFAKAVDRRLRRRHGDAEGVTPALFWHRAKAEAVASPPRKRMDNFTPERRRVAQLTQVTIDPVRGAVKGAAPSAAATATTAASPVGVRPRAGTQRR
jgi:hypothetical protein